MIQAMGVSLARWRRPVFNGLLTAGPPGQSVITTTDLDHIPGADGEGIARVAVVDGALLSAEGVVA